ncbi:endonuclease/exonuclease/phosphatase family protein [Chelativorans sp. M5D2P16]|uniref:endonuclease/exonuclease/phosphatase family protein n=1 Tax=Chelativorans sp. M5D2P16 TaxID=3095678 RepID=UPI002ACA8CD7|nr:endonuclease/exonuclease/phosphatase family protein [Chelativorans sp. M5D2P16]MDZ5695952.1 endonuclease/exonuclease/phosphatase family protein [Chelativorans sp. M5D2P16]
MEPPDTPQTDETEQAGAVAKVRTMTWNIHGGVGPDRRRDLQRVVEIVRRHEPDIVALQEIDSRRSAEAADAFAFLATALGGNSRESRLITAPDGDYGHAVISRWPMSGTTWHDISYRRREPRAAIETHVHTPFGPLHLVAAHLGLSLGERRHQARLIAEICRQSPERTVILGDFNDWIWRGSVQTTLNRLFPGHSHMKTYPAFRPLFALDRVYCRPSEMLRESWTDPEARKASDHLPVIAELAMERQG